MDGAERLARGEETATEKHFPLFPRPPSRKLNGFRYSVHVACIRWSHGVGGFWLACALGC